MYIQFFYGQNEKGKEKKRKMAKWQNGKRFDPPPLGFKPQVFEQNFPAQDLNFEEDRINRAHGS